jgi:hypothetical protein
VRQGRRQAEVAESQIDPGAHWKQAFVWEGQEYNFVLGSKGLSAERVRPLVKRSPDDPKILQVTIDNDEAGKRHLKQLSDSKKLKFLRRTDLPQVVMTGLQFTFYLDREMKLTALKMALATAMMAFPSEADQFSVARTDLGTGIKSESKCVEVDHRYHRALDSLRKPLSHTIYVEQSQSGIHAVVQFFGSFQFWIALSSSVSPVRSTGTLGTLDPVTGEEDFKEINRLGVPHWHPDAFLVPFAPITKFNGDALARGAKTGATLKLDKVNAADGQEIRIDKSPDSAWTWTGIGRPPKNVKFN